MPPDLIVALIAAGATAIALRRAWRVHQESQALKASLWRSASVINEAERIRLQAERLSTIQETAEAVIEGGTATVRAVHKGIADIPFGILESIPVTRDTTKLVRGVHDLTTDLVYGSISSINKTLGREIRRNLKPGVNDPASTNTKPGDKGE